MTHAPMSTSLPPNTTASKVLAVTMVTGPELSFGSASLLMWRSTLPACVPAITNPFSQYNVFTATAAESPCPLHPITPASMPAELSLSVTAGFSEPADDAPIYSLASEAYDGIVSG